MLTFTVGGGGRNKKDDFYVTLFLQIKHNKISEEARLKIRFKK